MQKTSTKNKYISLSDLEIYKLARQLSELGWQFYNLLDWQKKKIIGDQFIEATDSVGANIAEGYGRFHYLDRIKFFYNSRASLQECSNHWLELLKERNMITLQNYEQFKKISAVLSIKLNNFININYKLRNDKNIS